MRILTILIAYVLAAFVGSYGAVLAFNLFINDLGGSLQHVMGSPSLILVGLLVSAPVAVPLIVIAEIRKWQHPATYVAWGFGIGFLVAMTFFSFPILEWEAVRAAGIVGLVGAAAALIYFCVAWRMFPPKRIAVDKGKRHD